MKYDITKQSAPKLPTLGNGTECIKLLLSQTSKDMHEPLVPMLFPIFGHIWAVRNFNTPTSVWRPNGQFCGRKWRVRAKSICRGVGWLRSEWGMGRPERTKAFVGAIVAFGVGDGRPERAATKCSKPNGKRSDALGMTIAPASRALKGQKHLSVRIRTRITCPEWTSSPQVLNPAHQRQSLMCGVV